MSVAYAILKPSSSFRGESDMLAFIGLAPSDPSLQRILIPAEACAKLHSEFILQRKTMFRLGEKEASGMPLLGTLLVHIADALEEVDVLKNFKFSTDVEVTVMETGSRGRNPATDGAIFAEIQVKTPASDLISPLEPMEPIILYEYKPKVHPNIFSVDGRAVVELLIQAYYTFKQYKIKECILCLTDMNFSHYIKVNARMEIMWRKSLATTETAAETMVPTVKILEEHFSFIASAVVTHLIRD